MNSIDKRIDALVDSFTYVTQQATTDENLTIHDTAQFHYFNPNGLYAKKADLDDQINLLIYQEELPSGTYYSHGKGHTYFPDKLRAIVLHKKKVSKQELNLFLDLFRKELIKAEQLISTTTPSPNQQ